MSRDKTRTTRRRGVATPNEIFPDLVKAGHVMVQHDGWWICQQCGLVPYRFPFMETRSDGTIVFR